jgi:glycosyltransferase
MPDKIAVMMDCFFAHPDLSLVTSYRECIDADGNRMPDPSYTEPICEEPTKFDGASVGMKILLQTANFIGEPTTALAKKSFMLDGYRLGFTGKEGKYFISDFPTWLHLLARGNMMYLTEPLSQFRIHGDNGQLRPVIFVRSIICWALCIRAAIEQNVFLCDGHTRRSAIAQWLDIASVPLDLVKRMPELGDEPEFRDLQIVHRAMRKGLDNDCRIDFTIDTTVVLQPMEGTEAPY